MIHDHLMQMPDMKPRRLHVSSRNSAKPGVHATFKSKDGNRWQLKALRGPRCTLGSLPVRQRSTGAYPSYAVFVSPEMEMQISLTPSQTGRSMWVHGPSVFKGAMA